MLKINGTSTHGEAGERCGTGHEDYSQDALAWNDGLDKRAESNAINEYQRQLHCLVDDKPKI